MGHNSKHNNAGLTKLLQSSLGTIFHRTPLKPLSNWREHRGKDVKARDKKDKYCTDAATKYRNYNANETDKEREHPLQARRENTAKRICIETDE